MATSDFEILTVRYAYKKAKIYIGHLEIENEAFKNQLKHLEKQLEQK